MCARTYDPFEDWCAERGLTPTEQLRQMWESGEYPHEFVDPDPLDEACATGNPFVHEALMIFEKSTGISSETLRNQPLVGEAEVEELFDAFLTQELARRGVASDRNLAICYMIAVDPIMSRFGRSALNRLPRSAVELAQDQVLVARLQDELKIDAWIELIDVIKRRMIPLRII